MTTQAALVEILKHPESHTWVKDVSKLRAEIVKLLIDAQKLENEHQKIVNEAISSELEFSKHMRQYELDRLYEDGENDEHND